MNGKKKVEANPLIIGGVVIGMIAIVLLVVSLVGIVRGNPYGKETRIDNFDAFYRGTAQDTKDLIFHELYSAIADNLSAGKVPEAGALIRQGTTANEYDDKTKVHSGNFIVDVAAVEQSFKIQFEWSEEKDNKSLGGYPVLVTCPPKELVIYSGGCVDDLSVGTTWENTYQLDYTFGATKAGKVREIIEKHWDEDAKNSHKIVVDETSLTKLTGWTSYAYQFRIVRDEVEMYTVTVWLENFSNEGKVKVEVVGN